MKITKFVLAFILLTITISCNNLNSDVSKGKWQLPVAYGEKSLQALLKNSNIEKQGDKSFFVIRHDNIINLNTKELFDANYLSVNEEVAFTPGFFADITKPIDKEGYFEIELPETINNIDELRINSFLILESHLPENLSYRIEFKNIKRFGMPIIIAQPKAWVTDMIFPASSEHKFKIEYKISFIPKQNTTIHVNQGENYSISLRLTKNEIKSLKGKLSPKSNTIQLSSDNNEILKDIDLSKIELQGGSLSLNIKASNMKFKGNCNLSFSNNNHSPIGNLNNLITIDALNKNEITNNLPFESTQAGNTNKILSSMIKSTTNIDWNLGSDMNMPEITLTENSTLNLGLELKQELNFKIQDMAINKEMENFAKGKLKEYSSIFKGNIGLKLITNSSIPLEIEGVKIRLFNADKKQQGVITSEGKIASGKSMLNIKLSKKDIDLLDSSEYLSLELILNSTNKDFVSINENQKIAFHIIATTNFN